MTRRCRREALTLVELLVILAIIALVAALLVPAAQVARENARQVQCANNLKQFALSCRCHEEANGWFPTDGWGAAWTGDADLGFGPSQPGGWIYNIGPYIESNSWHDLGCGVPASQKSDCHLKRLEIPLSVCYCMSRRLALTYPWLDSWQIANAGKPLTVGRCDYAANGGDVYTSPGAPRRPRWQSAPPGFEAGPASLADGGVRGSKAQEALAKETFGNVEKAASGVIYCGSQVKLADIVDGTAETLLLAEKSIGSDWYATGQSPGDDKAALIGDNEDIARWTFRPPLPDTPGYDGRWRFGGPHADGFQTAFCDGAVRMTSYQIDADVYRRLGNRKDSLAITKK
jgi:hypothetical protein